MSKTLLALGAAAVAALVTRWAVLGAAPSHKLLRRNYRGIEVPIGLGVGLLAGIVAGMALVGLVHTVAPRAPSPSVALLGAVPLLALAFGFGLLGLFDDLSDDAERGWRAHLPALARGRVTGGTLKLGIGFALAFAVASAGESSIGWALVDAAIIGLMANLYNALDLRPARAVKAFLIAGVPLAIVATGIQVPFAGALGAAAAFGGLELRERAMLGDAGSNALGAIVGAGVLATDPRGWVRLVLLAVLVALTAVAEGPTLSAWIDRIGPLRALDRAGRVPESRPETLVT